MSKLGFKEIMGIRPTGLYYVEFSGKLYDERNPHELRELRNAMCTHPELRPQYRDSLMAIVFLNVKIPTLAAGLPVSVMHTDTAKDVIDRVVDARTKKNLLNKNIRFGDLRLWVGMSNTPLNNEDMVFAKYNPRVHGHLFLQYDNSVLASA
ncbi:hypothetical protein LPJ70_004134 [Coemansia sp. RSA 2708]|nr:hypothetical protein LPJ70_004134 [Coemansia sp. RSA 2708]